MQDFIYISDLFGTAVFALTGALAAFKHRMDPFGLLVLAMVTAVGGGTIRDMILGTTPAFWLNDLNYFWMIICTCVVSLFFLNEKHHVRLSLLPIADAFGLALFSVIGANKALVLGYSWPIAIIMGVLTGVGGGMIRDVFCQRVPFVLQKEVYATAAMLGAFVYSLGYYFNMQAELNCIIAMLTTLTLRLGALYWHISLPMMKIRKADKSST